MIPCAVCQVETDCKHRLSPEAALEELKRMVRGYVDRHAAIRVVGKYASAELTYNKTLYRGSGVTEELAKVDLTNVVVAKEGRRHDTSMQTS